MTCKKCLELMKGIIELINEILEKISLHIKKIKEEKEWTEVYIKRTDIDADSVTEASYDIVYYEGALESLYFIESSIKEMNNNENNT